MLRLAFVAGVTPAKWLRIRAERTRAPIESFRTEQSEQLDALRAGDADIALVRLPIDDAGLNVIPLYSEIAVVVLPKDHPLADVEEFSLADIADERRVTDAESTAGAMLMELVAAGVGVAVVPHSVARLHSRKDLVARPVTDAPETRIAIVWPAEPIGGDSAAGTQRDQPRRDQSQRDQTQRDQPQRDQPRSVEALEAEIEQFIGIVRGRTVNSSRGSAASAPEPAKKSKKKAPQQTARKPGPKPARHRGSQRKKGRR